MHSPQEIHRLPCAEQYIGRIHNERELPQFGLPVPRNYQRNRRLPRRDKTSPKIGHDIYQKGRIVLREGLALCGWLMASLVCVAQNTGTAPPLALDAKPIPVLSAGVAFVPTWDSGNPTLVSIISPVLLVPLGKNLVFESRAGFEGDFQRRDGNSGEFTGAVQKSLDYMELDYLANRYVTVTAGRFLTPFNIFNERLYPNLLRNTQTDPLIFPIGTGSDNGLMLRGGIAASQRISLNYAVYFSALSNADHFESERHAGMRAGVFLPRERLEIGMSVQHQLQDQRLSRYGFHLQWQPLHVPFELRSEGAYSEEEGNGLWIEGAYRFRNANWTALRRAQVVCRTQAFHTGSAAASDSELPGTDAKRTEFGANYYLNDGWKGLFSYGRTFTPLGDSNIWTVGMTYRFVLPLGPGQ